MRVIPLSVTLAVAVALFTFPAASAQLAKPRSPAIARASVRLRAVVSRDVLEAARRAEDQAHANAVDRQKASIEKVLPRVKAELDLNAPRWRAAAEKAGLDEKTFETDLKRFAGATSDAERAQARETLAAYDPALARFRAAAGIQPDFGIRFAAAAGVPAMPAALPAGIAESTPAESSISFTPPFTVMSTSADSSADADGNMRAHYASTLLWWGENRAAYTFVVDLDPAVRRLDVIAAAETQWAADVLAAFGYAAADASFGVQAQVEGQSESCQALRGGSARVAGIDRMHRSGQSPADATLRCSVMRPADASTRLIITVWVHAGGSSIVGASCNALSTAKLQRVIVEAR